MTEQERTEIQRVLMGLQDRIMTLEAAHRAWGRIIKELSVIAPQQARDILKKYPDYCSEAKLEELIQIEDMGYPGAAARLANPDSDSPKLPPPPRSGPPVA
jgi:hypothetical protein